MSEITAKGVLEDMLFERQEQVKICEQNIGIYSDDKDQVEAFRRKKEHNEFMVDQLSKKLSELKS